MNSAEQFIWSLEAKDVRQLALRVHYKLLGKGAPLRPIIKHGIPFYYLKHRIFYLRAGTDCIWLGFCNGAHLDDPSGIFEGGERKVIRLLRFDQSTDLENPYIDDLIIQAIEFHDENKTDATS